MKTFHFRSIWVWLVINFLLGLLHAKAATCESCMICVCCYSMTPKPIGDHSTKSRENLLVFHNILAVHMCTTLNEKMPVPVLDICKQSITY